jgi:hypothetical protein
MKAMMECHFNVQKLKWGWLDGNSHCTWEVEGLLFYESFTFLVSFLFLSSLILLSMRVYLVSSVSLCKVFRASAAW